MTPRAPLHSMPGDPQQRSATTLPLRRRIIGGDYAGRVEQSQMPRRRGSVEFASGRRHRRKIVTRTGDGGERELVDVAPPTAATRQGDCTIPVVMEATTMPLYEFTCLDCGRDFTLVLSVYDSQDEKKKRSCPRCQSDRIERLVTTGEVVPSRKS